VGVRYCTTLEEASAAARTLVTHFGRVLVEEYVTGRELTVPVLSTSVSVATLPIVELLLLDSPIYDQAVKSRSDRVLRTSPADLPPHLHTVISRAAATIHQVLRCSGLTRVDFRLDANDAFSFLEINGSPALAADDHVGRSLAAAGIRYDLLVAFLLFTAARPIGAAT
jgi:D-alanine-D-alanine ligase